MNPKQGQLIQVRLTNGAFFDGVVESWSDQKSVLILPDTNDTIIIQKTLQDVMLIKIFNEQTTKKYHAEVESNQQIPKEYLSERFQELKEQPKNKDSISEMAKLKDRLNVLEREEISSKFKSHELDSNRNINYGFPGHIPLSSTSQHTNKETPQRSNELGTKLQDLFSKKYSSNR